MEATGMFELKKDNIRLSYIFHKFPSTFAAF